MKIEFIGVVLLLALSQCSASFFDSLKGAVSSMRSGVGQLLSDVAIDVKDTLECTVHAVRQAISSDNSSSEYYEKCHTKSSDLQRNNTPISTQQPISIFINLTNPNTEIKENTKEINEMSHKIEESILSINADLIKEADIEKLEKKLVDAEELLESESKRLLDMNLAMEREFDFISKNLDDEIKRLEEDDKKLSIDKVLKEIQLLRKEETINKNKTEEEMRKIIKDLEKNSAADLDVKKEMEAAINEMEKLSKRDLLEQELLKWKEEEMQRFNEIINAINEQNHKEEATTATDTTTTNSETILDYDSLVKYDEKSVQQAMDLIENSKRQASIMDEILQNADSAPLFDNLDFIFRSAITATTSLDPI